jgi:hypothetical protein
MLPYLSSGDLNAISFVISNVLQCLRPPYGVVYLAAKKNLVGSNSRARQMKALLDEDGILGARFFCELLDREIWKIFFK